VRSRVYATLRSHFINESNDTWKRSVPPAVAGGCMISMDIPVGFKSIG
jgi:hypothetical protein